MVQRAPVVRPVSEPRARKELVELDKTLAAVEDLTPKLRKDLIDLQEMAWSQEVAERPERSSRKQGWALSDVGDPRAKRALKELDKTAFAFLNAMRQTRNLFVGGPGPNTMARDTFLGTDGHGAQGELNQLQRAQERRRARGEYVPNRLEPQPKVTGSR